MDRTGTRVGRGILAGAGAMAAAVGVQAGLTLDAVLGSIPFGAAVALAAALTPLRPRPAVALLLALRNLAWGCVVALGVLTIVEVAPSHDSNAGLALLGACLTGLGLVPWERLRDGDPLAPTSTPTPK